MARNYRFFHGSLLTGLLMAPLGAWSAEPGLCPAPAVPACPAGAEGGPWSLCAPLDTLGPVPPAIAAEAAATEVPPGAVRLYADESTLVERDRATFTGNVSAIRTQEHIYADRVDYHLSSEMLYATGNVRYQRGGLTAFGDRAEVQLARDVGHIEDTRYVLEDRHARGTADRTVLSGDGQARLTTVTYTTCSPGEELWRLKAQRMHLNRETGTGTARHVRLHLGSVPVFYSPYLSFPIDDRRKSGFLIPRIGQSTELGFDLQVPYYWNIAPNMDATFSPRVMSDRGVLLDSEFRYLTENHHGRVVVGYLPEDQETGDNRHFLDLEHTGALSEHWTLRLDAARASDSFYLDDFGNSLADTSTTHLSRRADLRYRNGGLSLLGRVQEYQTLDEAINPRSHPYRRLPQILIDYRPLSGPDWLDWEIESEYVQFEHDHDERITGQRVDIQPTARLRLLDNPGYYFTPGLAVQHTQYDLNAPVAAGGEASPSRTAPIASVDSGLFLERDIRWMGRDTIQTLEPRLYYLYVPYRDQEDLPRFDTSEFSFSFLRLFSPTRYSGPDRLGDANQLTTALTSRLIDADTGRERLTTSIGVIHHFQDREVTLNNQDPDTDRYSPLVGEIRWRPLDPFQFITHLQWDPDDARTEQGRVQLDYAPGPLKRLHLAYRMRRDRFITEPTEQISVGGIWPLTPRWRAIAAWQHSLRRDRDLETIAGLEYESCCWAVRILYRKYLTNDLRRIEEATATEGIFFELSLKGLASLGQRTDALLERGILGNH